MTTTLSPPVFVTLQTKGPSLLQKVGGPFKVVNLGAGKPWHGYKTKFELLLPFLRSKKDDDLVAFMDGSDIFWGGCEMNDFMHYYQQILEASGASIVISAEIACGEQPCGKIPPAPKWAVELANKSLNDGFWQRYVTFLQVTACTVCHRFRSFQIAWKYFGVFLAKRIESCCSGEPQGMWQCWMPLRQSASHQILEFGFHHGFCQGPETDDSVVALQL